MISASSSDRPRGSSTPWVLALILFGSGLCSLTYQTVWLREFRLVFGGAAPAASAVIAVFMAGLGFGGAWFGQRVERVSRPLRFYAWLEAAIALSAAATPLLLGLAEEIYLFTGGAGTLGLWGATVVQILVTTLVLGGPCFLIGGTLPAAMKFAQRDEDVRRSDTALFYGINVAGALGGAALGTFVLLPNWGNRGTLMAAVMLNGAIAAVAALLSMRSERGTSAAGESTRVVAPILQPVNSPAAAPGLASWFVLTAAFLSGFTFFVAELVWYRMSTPLLGGTVYGFGVVLCVVLFGMSVGGMIYSQLLRRWQPTLVGFSLVVALQAVAVAIPYALGDRLSYFAVVLNQAVRGFGFGPLVGGWFVIMSVLAFFPALLSGIQFPLLVSLLGRGNAGIGREIGRAYFWNTLGSISGSLIGGFLLIPVLSATHTWVAVSVAIAGVAILSLVLAFRQGGLTRTAWVSSAGVVGCIAMLVTSTGPTAAWRQAPIGYGRMPNYPKNGLELETWERDMRRQSVLAFDGRDANVAVVEANDQRAFITNGKSDGSSLGDAATQTMLGLVGAIVHPREITRCAVIGLGTGTSAGWLASLPAVKQVDVIEIESRAVDIARRFSAVNRGALDNPKVRMILGDAREVMQGKGPPYDLIASEPSNPYRAGVANLYTREFYRGVKGRLTPDGVFCQWLQGYETNTPTTRVVIATLCSEFSKVEVWNTQSSDLLFVCSKAAEPWNADLVRQRILQPVYNEACTRLWHTDSAEGFFGHSLASARFTREVVKPSAPVNTDDRNALEFAAARNMGHSGGQPMRDLFAAALARGQGVAEVSGRLDEDQLAVERIDSFSQQPELGDAVIQYAGKELGSALRQKQDLTGRFATGDGRPYIAVFTNLTPQTVEEKFIFAVATSQANHPKAVAAAEELARVMPETRPVLAALRAQAAGNAPQEAEALCEALRTLRRYPWIDQRMMRSLSARLLEFSSKEVLRDPRLAAQIFNALKDPFLDGTLVDTQRNAMTLLGAVLGSAERQLAVASWGEHYPFNGDALTMRLMFCAETSDSRLPIARKDMERFIELGGKVPAGLRSMVEAVLAAAPGGEAAAMRRPAPVR